MRCRLPAVGANSTQAPGSKNLALTAFPSSGRWVVVKRLLEAAAEAGDDGADQRHRDEGGHEREGQSAAPPQRTHSRLAAVRPEVVLHMRSRYETQL